KLPLVIDENAGPTSIDLEHTDPDDEASGLLYTLAATLYGEVTLDGTVLSAGDTFTQQQIDAGFVRFEPMYPANLAEGATVAGGIDYSITDGIATSGGPGGPPLEYRVSIRGVNDGQPSVTVLAPVTPAQLTFDGSV